MGRFPPTSDTQYPSSNLETAAAGPGPPQCSSTKPQKYRRKPLSLGRESGSPRLLTPERTARVMRFFILSKDLVATFCPVGTYGAAAVSGRIIYRSPLLIPIILSPERQLPIGLPSIHPVRAYPVTSSQKIHCESVAVGSDDVFIFVALWWTQMRFFW